MQGERRVKRAPSTSLHQALEDTRALHTRWMRERESVIQTYDQGRRQLVRLEASAAVAVELSDRRTLLDKRRQEHATIEALLEADRHAQRLLTDTRTCPFFMDVCRNLDAIPDVAGVFQSAGGRTREPAGRTPERPSPKSSAPWWRPRQAESRVPRGRRCSASGWRAYATD